MLAGRYAELQLPVIEALHRYEIGLAELPARTVRRCGTEWTFARIGEVTSGADHIFLSVDMDVLDPAHAPGVGWHEPGGLTSGELLDLLVALAPRVGGFVLNEVNPLTDAGPKTTILAANLIFQFAVAAAVRNEGCAVDAHQPPLTLGAPRASPTSDAGGAPRPAPRHARPRPLPAEGAVLRRVPR